MKRKSSNDGVNHVSAASIVKSQRDRFFINSLQQNVHAQRHYGIIGPQGASQRVRDAPNEDFITMYLIKWPLKEMIKATFLLLRIMEKENPHTIESRFADMTGIFALDDAGEPRFYSFRRYYERIYQWALEKQASLIDDEMGFKEEEKELLLEGGLSAVAAAVNEDLGTLAITGGAPVLSKVHVINLLRACFVIGFVHDIRIRRFVMAQHTLHKEYMKTSPPIPERVSAFITDSVIYVDDYLQRGNNGEPGAQPTILDMINEVIRIWLRIRHTTQVPLGVKIIDVKT